MICEAEVMVLGEQPGMLRPFQTSRIPVLRSGWLNDQVAY
jgi:hypothetical protein